MNTSSNVVTETPKLVTPYCSRLSGDKVCLLVHANTSLASYRPILSRTYTRILIRSFRITYDWTIHSLRKQPAYGDTTTGFPEKWRLTNERINSIVTMRHYLDLGSASDWLKQISHAARPIKSTTQSDASSLWNFCPLFLVVISRRNQWRRCKMSAVF